MSVHKVFSAVVMIVPLVTILAPRFDPRKICCLILLLLYLPVLIGRVGAEDETAYLSCYPSSYNLLRGRHVIGSFPSSVQITDSNCLILQSAVSDSFFSTGPSGYILEGLTSWISGNLSDVTSRNDVCMTFESYYSGINTADSVDNTISNVDSSADKGTHSSFSAQQAGPDSIFDLLTEENTSGASNTTLIDNESFEGTWPLTGWTQSGRWNKENDRAYDGNYSADFDYPGGFPGPAESGNMTTPDLDCSDADAIYVDFWYRDDDCDSNDFLLWYYNGSNWKLISDLGSTIQEDQWLHYQEKITNDQYFVSTFKVRWCADTIEIGENIWVDLVTVREEMWAYNYELDLEVQWTTADYDEANEELAIYVEKGNNTHSLDATGGFMTIGDGTPDWGSTIGTISFWVKMDGSVQGRFWGQDGDMETRWSGTNLMLDWGGTSSMTSAYSFVADRWYFIAIVWDEINDNLSLYVGDQDDLPTLDANSLNRTWAGTTPPPIENRFLNGFGGDEPVDGHADDLRYWNATRSLTEIQNDYNTELTGSEPNLRSYFKLNNDFDDVGPDNNDGSSSGPCLFSSEVSFGHPPTENIQVDVWYSGSWQNLLTNLTEGWNNVSVSPYFDSSTFTIRFSGSEEVGDTIQDSRNVDVVLLHTWSDEQIAEIEFTGSSSLQNWSNINWTACIWWTIGSVSVTMQLYNFSQGGYSPDGSGCLIYNSSAIAQEDEIRSQIVPDYLNHFRNGTGHWKMRIRGVKAIDANFELKVDWIQFKLSDDYVLSTEFIFSEMTTDTAIRLNFTVTSRYSECDVNITVQVWNHSLSAYTTDIEACLKYASDGSNETETLSIGTNAQFYISNGTSRIRIRGESPIPFRQEINQIELRYGYSTTHPWGQLLGWPGILLFAVPITIGLLFVPILISRGRKKSEPVFEDRVNPFSSSFEMTHKQMSGKKLLLEVDPTVDFQKALFSFVSEARINSEKVCIFTSKSSPLYSKFSGTKGIKFYLLTSKTSSPRRKNAKETLLAAHDLSVLLNTIVKIQGTRRRKPVKIVFDNLSDTVLLCGFEKTYKFVRWALETISSSKITILFVYNPAAHDPKTSSSIRGLFQTQLAYGKDGPKVGTL